MLLRFQGKTVNERFIEQIVQTLKSGGIIIIPTDTVYALAGDIHNSKAMEKICRFKNIKPEKANFSFLCASLSNISEFTKPFNTEIFRLMKNSLPGPFTFILNANNNVPEFSNQTRKQSGSAFLITILPKRSLKHFGNPLMVTSVHDDDQFYDYVTDPEVIDERFGSQVDIVVDGGMSEFEPSTVIDCTGNEPVLIRQGKGVIAMREMESFNKFL
ncbi:MAG: threonylcarbamoyl-AMP synthase [Bacteroidetes bacterium]|nr:threonylcarbamoyl-AMP synthase [Bacteroidota bacterium]